METAKRKRKVRGSSEPLPGLERPIAQLNQNHFDVLNVLVPTERYTYLPWPWMYALLGEGHWWNFQDRLRKMAEKPNFYVARPEQQQPPGYNNTRHHVYTLAPRGAQELEIHPKRPPREYRHQLIQDVTKASIELGCRSRGFRFIDWSYLKSSDGIPAEAHAQTVPWNIPLTGKSFYAPDGPPIIIDFGEHRYRYLFTEIDCGTEPLTVSAKAKTNGRRTIQSLFEEIGQVMQKRLYESHFNFESALFLIVATKTSRMHAMMQIAEQTLGSVPYLLFKTTEEWQRDANDKILATPWSRIGHEPFDLSTWSS